MHKIAIGGATCFFGFILWVIYLANSGGRSLLFDFVGSLRYGDKLGHLCLFGALTLAVVAATKFRSFSLGRLHLYYGVVVVSLFVFVEEVSQVFIATRTFDLIDLVADIVGIVMAASVACLIDKKFNGAVMR